VIRCFGASFLAESVPAVAIIVDRLQIDSDSSWQALIAIVIVYLCSAASIKLKGNALDLSMQAGFQLMSKWSFFGRKRF